MMGNITEFITKQLIGKTHHNWKIAHISDPETSNSENVLWETFLPQGPAPSPRHPRVNEKTPTGFTSCCCCGPTLVRGNGGVMYVT